MAKKDDALQRWSQLFHKPGVSEIRVRIATKEKVKLQRRAKSLNKTLSGFCSEILYMIGNLSDEGLLDFTRLIEKEAGKLKTAKESKDE